MKRAQRPKNSERETIACEVCEQQKPLTDGCQLGSCDICEDCMRGWRADAAKCEHAWELYSGDFGVGRVCTKCSMFMLEDAAHA